MEICFISKGIYQPLLSLAFKVHKRPDQISTSPPQYGPEQPFRHAQLP